MPYISISEDEARKIARSNTEAKLLEIFPKGERYAYRYRSELVLVANVLVCLNFVLLAAATVVMIAGGQ